MKTKRLFLLLFCLLPVLTGCAASGNFGKLVRNAEITKAFENATVMPGHTYYYSGPEAKPDAIIALDNSFTLANEKKFWIKVDITEEQLRSWNLIIRNDTRIRFPYYGSRILTPDGRDAGAWYSKYDYTVIKTPSPQEIIIYTPDVQNQGPGRLDSFGAPGLTMSPVKINK